MTHKSILAGRGAAAIYLGEAAPDEQKLPWSNDAMADSTNANDDSGPLGCPLDPALALLAQKWLVHIVWLLGRAESLRFTELQRQVPGDVSAKVLSARLKQLETLKMIARDDKGTSPPHVEYRLTSYGRSIDGLLVGIELKARDLSLPVVALASLPEEAVGS
jgi:DNA-binding HxlR family transcriptional regulator